MAFTAYRTWTPGETVTAALLNAQVRDNGNAIITPLQNFQRGAALTRSTGFPNSALSVLMSPPFPLSGTITKVRGRQVGGTSVTINVAKNGTDDLMASDLVMDSAGTWFSSTVLQNETFEPEDFFEVDVVAATGLPTEIDAAFDYSVMEAA